MCNSKNLRYSYLLFAGRAWCFCQGCFHRGKVLWRTRAAMETKCRPIHRKLWLFPYTKHARRTQQQRQVQRLSTELQARGNPKRDFDINFKILSYLRYHHRPTKLRIDNVFTRVCHSVHGRGVPDDHYRWCIELHCTSPRHVQHFSLWSTYSWQVGKCFLVTAGQRSCGNVMFSVSVNLGQVWCHFLSGPMFLLGWGMVLGV